MTNNLTERLKAATCGSRELDVELAIQFHPRNEDGTFKGPFKYPHYTTSLDAALALVGEVLPEHAVQLTEYKDDEWRAVLERGGISRYGGLSYHQSAPIALLIALLTALEAEGGRS